MTLSTAAKPERLRKIKRVNQIKFRQSEENYKFYIAFIKNYRYKFSVNALVAEQVDAADLKSVDRKVVPVQVRPGAPLEKSRLCRESAKPLFLGERGICP